MWHSAISPASAAGGESPRPTTAYNAVVANCGITRIDALLAGQSGAATLLPGDSDTAAVGVAQELLRTHGFSALPDIRGSGYGSFGDRTRNAVLQYRASCGLGDSPCIDAPLLASLVRAPAAQPCAGRGYCTLVLGFDWAPPLSLVALTSLFESEGRFDCLNCNTDRAGLSFGIIQWAQKPGRLHELLAAFDAAAPSVFRALAGGPQAAASLLAHTARPNGGVNPKTGVTTNAACDLVSAPWKDRFDRMGHAAELQKVQLDCAARAFRKSLAILRAKAPAIRTQRGAAFMADVANQHGDAGAVAIYQAVCANAPAEAPLLESMARESVRRVAAQFGPGSPEAASTTARRAFFRTTPFLSDAVWA
jgi:hypothetical protein